MNINITPFSYSGAYMSIFKHDDKLWIQSLHGKSKGHMDSMEILVTHDGKAVSFKTIEKYTSLELVTAFGTVNICFNTASKIVFHSSDNLGLRFEAHPKFNFEYSFLLGTKDDPYYIINSYKNLTKYLIYTQNCSSKLLQSLSVDNTGSNKTANNSSAIDILPAQDDSSITCVVEDIPRNMSNPSSEPIDFENIQKKAEQVFAEFTQQFKLVQPSFRKTQLDAAYILWSSTVAPQGNLKVPSIYASNNKFPGVWSWDHCFMALALAGVDNNLAWNQMKTVFQHQDETGQLPGSVSDSTIRWNFSKPPVHAFFFKKMQQKMNFSKSQLTQIYIWISKQVQFYFNYKDSNHDDICEYDHGNDSGQDNSTVFNKNTVVDSPDLSAYLIYALDYLIDLGKQLNQSEQVYNWVKQRDALLEKFNDYFFDEQDLPFAREMFTGQKINSQGLLPFMTLLIGSDLAPQRVKKMSDYLKAHFLTDYGISTEAIDSPDYQGDAYWRGPIWGPSTVLMFEALKDIGETDLATQIAKSFCRTVEQYGFAENFDAKTGRGLRDKSFSWTASAFLYLASELNL